MLNVIMCPKEYDFLAHQVSLASLIQTISLSVEKGEVLCDKISTSKPLAVLCIEDGLPTLRFSKIFGDTSYVFWNDE